MDQPKDTRVYMFRADETRLFGSSADVPEGEGWVDHPDKVNKPAKGKPFQKKLKAVEAEEDDAE
jgi:hypothetical protein